MSDEAAKVPDLKKSVEMLAIVPTKDKLTLLSRKVYNVMMFYAQQQSIENHVFYVELRRVAKNIDFTSKNTEVLKEHLRQMVTTKVEWQSPTTGEGARWGVATLIAHAELLNKNGEVWLEWSYAPRIKEAIFDPDRYSKISLENQANIKSLAGLALYEICARYVDNPGGLTARQTLSWWRPVLTGDPLSRDHGAYLDWKIFNRDVVKKAVAEVNRATDLDVEQIEHKRGRSVAELQFKVKRKIPKKSVNLSNLNPINLEDIGKAINLGINQQTAEKLLEQHGENKLKSALAKLEKRTGNKNYEPVLYPDKYLTSVLNSDELIDELKYTKNNKENQTLGRDSRLSLLEKYRDEKRKEVYSLYSELTDKDKDQYTKDFEVNVLNKDPVLKKIWNKSGIDGRIGKSFFIKFMCECMWGPGWENPTDTQLLDFGLTNKSGINNASGSK